MKRFLCLLALLLACTAWARGETLLFASDLHLGDDTPGTLSLLDELLQAGSGADAVLLLGDVTNNGKPAERALLLDALEDTHGARVLLLPGNHDLMGRTGADFAQDFAAYGWDLALSVEPESRSYAVRLTDALWVAMLNTCHETLEGADPSGSIAPGLLAWAQGLMDQAQQSGARVLFCGHHPVLPHSVNEEKRADLTAGREDFAALLAASPLPLYLAGHRHIAHWAQQGGANEILAGKLGAWPLRAGKLEMTGSEARFTVLELGTPEQRMQAEADSHEKAQIMARAALTGTAMEGDEDMVGWFDRAYSAYISGSLYAIRDDLRQSPAFARWQSGEITSIFRPWTAFLLEHMTGDYTRLEIALP